MNVRFLLAAAALATVAAGTLANVPAHASEPAPLHWDCSRIGTPTLRETAATYGYDNYTQVVTARDALYRQIRMSCERGEREVVVVVPGKRGGQAAERRVAAR